MERCTEDRKTQYQDRERQPALCRITVGEIDITQPTMSVIPEEDYDSVEALSNVNVVYGEPVTNQSVFIQTKNVPDVRVRQAMLYAIDRKMVLEQLLKGKG